MNCSHGTLLLPQPPISGLSGLLRQPEAKAIPGNHFAVPTPGIGLIQEKQAEAVNVEKISS
jgi:hypothetical protein